MSIEYVKQIKEKELEAEKIIQDSMAESSRIINSANDTALELIEKAKLRASEIHAEIISKAETEAQLDYEKIIDNTEWECDMFWANSKEHQDVAISIISEEVVT